MDLMKAQKEFQQTEGIEEIKRFHNESDEMFVIYKNTKCWDVIFITWDELDWEQDWIITEDNNIAKFFQTSDNEKEKIKSILLELKK